MSCKRTRHETLHVGVGGREKATRAHASCHKFTREYKSALDQNGIRNANPPMYLKNKILVPAEVDMPQEKFAALETWTRAA